MKKLKNLLFVAIVAIGATFFSLNSSNEIVCGNIEALTSGDNGSSGPEQRLVSMGRKATKEERNDSKRGIYGVTLTMGFSELSVGKHTIDDKEYTDCGTYTYDYVIYDKDYGKCVAWWIGFTPLGSWTTCPEHTPKK